MTMKGREFLSRATRSPLYSNAFYLMANSAANSGLGFIFWNVMAGLFPATEVGVGSTLVAAAGLVVNLGNLGLGIGLLRFVPEAGSERAGQFVNAVFTLAVTVTVVLALVYLSGLNFWTPALAFIREDMRLAVLFIFCAAALGLCDLVDYSLMARRATRYVLWKNLLVSLTKLFLPALFFGRLGGPGIFVSFGIAAAAGVSFALIRLLPRVYPGYIPRPRFSFGEVRSILPYSTVNYLAVLFNGATGMVLPLLVLHGLGAEYSAYFYLAWMMSNTVGLMVSGIAVSLFVEGSYNPALLAWQTRRSLVLAWLLLLPVTAGIYLLAPHFLVILGDDYTRNCTGVVRILILANFPTALNILYLTVNRVRGRLYLIILQAGFTTVLTLGLARWLMFRYGLVGVGLAHTCAQLFVFLVAAVSFWRWRKNELTGEA